MFRTNAKAPSLDGALRVIAFEKVNAFILLIHKDNESFLPTKHNCLPDISLLACVQKDQIKNPSRSKASDCLGLFYIYFLYGAMGLCVILSALSFLLPFVCCHTEGVDAIQKTCSV